MLASPSAHRIKGSRQSRHGQQAPACESDLEGYVSKEPVEKGIWRQQALRDSEKLGEHRIGSMPFESFMVMYSTRNSGADHHS